MPANAILIVGEAGSGKSSSIDALPPEQTFIINVSSKPLPFRGWRNNYSELTKENPKGNLVYTDNADAIVKTMEYVSTERPEIKYLIVDDSQYVAANEYMRRVNDKGFDKFTQIALGIFKLPTAVKKLRSDLFVFFMNHSETIQDSEGIMKVKAKTLGKMIDNTITYEGLFSIVLFTYKKATKAGIEYGFTTNGDPGSTAKSPRGMFEENEIPNDLMVVANAVKRYEEVE